MTEYGTELLRRQLAGRLFRTWMGRTHARAPQTFVSKFLSLYKFIEREGWSRGWSIIFETRKDPQWSYLLYLKNTIFKGSLNYHIDIICMCQHRIALQWDLCFSISRPEISSTLPAQFCNLSCSTLSGEGNSAYSRECSSFFVSFKCVWNHVLIEIEMC